MGWTGRYLDFCPKGQERIMEAIKQEGYNFCEPDRRSRVIGSALVGSTVYLAVKYDSESLHCVYGAVILTAYDKNRGEFLTKGMSESMVPCSYDCPKRILDMLTPAEDECAKEWRKLCAEKRAQKKPDDLAKLPEGTMIEINGFGGMWMIDKRKNRKVAINYGIMKYLPLSMVRKYGWNRKEA